MGGANAKPLSSARVQGRPKVTTSSRRWNRMAKKSRRSGERKKRENKEREMNVQK